MICTTASRNESKTTAASPVFADYFIDGEGGEWRRQPSKPSRLIVTDWFQPGASQCGQSPINSNDRCANLGDELGALLLSKLSGDAPIEKRQEGMDVVVIGSVLNWMVSNYNVSVHRIGSSYNTTVWGAGTK